MKVVAMLPAAIIFGLGAVSAGFAANRNVDTDIDAGKVSRFTHHR